MLLHYSPKQLLFGIPEKWWTSCTQSEREHSSERVTLTLTVTSTASWRDSKPCSGLIICQKDSKNSLKAIIFMVKIYCRERLQTEVSHGRQYTEQSLRKYPVQSFHCPLSRELGHIAFLALICDKKHRLLPTKEAHQSIGVQNFYWGSIR